MKLLIKKSGVIKSFKSVVVLMLLLNIVSTVSASVSTFGLAVTNAAGLSQLSNINVHDSGYLAPVIMLLQKRWPDNRTINLVFHGHSVPSGYLNTPIVDNLASYPLMVLQKLGAAYPTAVINSIKTCIGGENAEQGARRFKHDVLVHKPDVLFIDYALNDRNIGLERARKAWVCMIEQSVKAKIKVVLLTPTPDLTENIQNPSAPLAQHTAQIMALAKQYNLPVINSYQAFKDIQHNNNDLSGYMAQSNHINQKGHAIVATLIAALFDVK